MIYFDNAATSYPKPQNIALMVQNAIYNYGANPGRSGHSFSVKTARMVYECRENIQELFNVSDPEKVVFTQNCTHALNMAIKGVMLSGGHAIISSLEHNSVLRPLHELKKRKVADYSVANVSEDDERTIESFKKLIRSDTKAIICTHASNVCGVVMPIKEIGALAHENGLLFIVDAAQTAGILPIDVGEMNIDILCMPGHKGLYGPFGTGVMIVNCDTMMDTIIEGGTGSNSLIIEQPDFLPDRFESGTINVCGIAGLNSGVNFLKKNGINKMYQDEMSLVKRCYNGLKKNPAVIFYTNPPQLYKNAPIICFNIEGKDSLKTVERLNKYSFALRGGFHCSLLAHEWLGTTEIGAVRASFGAFNNENQIVRFIDIIKKLSKS